MQSMRTFLVGPLPTDVSFEAMSSRVRISVLRYPLIGSLDAFYDGAEGDD